MKIAGIIAEYDPFHNGHRYHIEETKKRTGAEGIIVVMSGDFVQRGEPALVDKYRRARMALMAGADLVLELPLPAATGSAEYFAKGAVSVLCGCGCVTELSFGAECADTELLERASLLSEREDWNLLLRSKLKEGMAYPKAAAAAAAAIDPALSEVLCSPNNLLATEYLKALRSAGSTIRPFALQREGQAYRDTDTALFKGAERTFASASAVRAALHEGKRPEELCGFLPDYVISELDYQIRADDLSESLMQRLSGLSAEEMTRYRDVSPELAARIYAQRPYRMHFEELVEKTLTRAYSRARVKRALLHILLEITEEYKPEAGCLKILGLRKDSEVPGLVRRKALLPLTTKTADAVPGDVELTCRAAEIYNRLVYFRTGIRLEDDYRQSPVIIGK